MKSIELDDKTGLYFFRKDSGSVTLFKGGGEITLTEYSTVSSYELVQCHCTVVQNVGMTSNL